MQIDYVFDEVPQQAGIEYVKINEPTQELEGFLTRERDSGWLGFVVCEDAGKRDSYFGCMLL